MKTIKQIADEIGVSWEAIARRINREPLSIKLQPYIIKKEKNTAYIEIEGETIIKAVYQKNVRADSSNVRTEFENVRADNSNVRTDNSNVRADNQTANLYSPKLSLDYFKNVKGNNGQYTSLCPAHDDNNNSLSIKITNDRVLLHCHAGCSTDSIMSALGLPMSALFLEDNKPNRSKNS